MSRKDDSIIFVLKLDGIKVDLDINFDRIVSYVHHYFGDIYINEKLLQKDEFIKAKNKMLDFYGIKYVDSIYVSSLAGSAENRIKKLCETTVRECNIGNAVYCMSEYMSGYVFVVFNDPYGYYIMTEYDLLIDKASALLGMHQELLYESKYEIIGAYKYEMSF